MNLKTPKSSLIFIIWTFWVYLSAPFFEWANLDHILASGRLPANADSIGLPFGLFMIVWTFSIPFILGFAFWVWRQYPPPSALFGFNFKRPLWSFIWTLIFTFLCFDSFSLMVVNLYNSYFIGALQEIMLVYFFTLLRAIIVFGNENMSKKAVGLN